jgi:hypothetical protein
MSVKMTLTVDWHDLESHEFQELLTRTQQLATDLEQQGATVTGAFDMIGTEEVDPDAQEG